jgi:hypothetical protein
LDDIYVGISSNFFNSVGERSQLWKGGETAHDNIPSLEEWRDGSSEDQRQLRENRCNSGRRAYWRNGDSLLEIEVTAALRNGHSFEDKRETAAQKTRDSSGTELQLGKTELVQG